MQVSKTLKTRTVRVAGLGHVQNNVLPIAAGHRSNNPFSLTCFAGNKKAQTPKAHLAVNGKTVKFAGVSKQNPHFRGSKRRVVNPVYQKLESDNEMSMFAQMRHYLNLVTPEQYRKAAFMVSFVTSFLGLILTFAGHVRHNTKLSFFTMGTMVVNCIAQTLLAVGIESEAVEQLTAEIVENPTVLEGYLKIQHPDFNDTLWQGHKRDECECNEEEVSFLRKCTKISPLTGVAIRRLYRDDMHTHILPANAPPTAMTYAIRRQWEDFRYPDWFLASFWDITVQQIERLRRMKNMTSREESNSIPSSGASDNSASSDPSSTISDASTVVEPGRMVTELTVTEKAWEVFQTIGNKLICIFIYIFDCVTTKKPFSAVSLVQSMRLAKGISEDRNDLYDLYCTIMDKPTPRKLFEEKINEFSRLFSAFMEVPNYEFAKTPMRVSKMKATIETFTGWYNSLNKDDKQSAQIVYNLYITVNARIAQYYQTDIKNMSRQEPFLVLFTGEGGIGKTQLARNLMLRTCNEILKVDPKENIAEITPEDKYWPPFGGQTVALFDDAASAADLKDDLLFHNLKGICAPTLFNAASADISHKTNPINFKVIFSTTNTPIEKIMERIVQMFDVSSLSAFMRRMIIVDCNWNPKYGTHNPSAPWTNKYDTNNFGHIQANLKSYKVTGSNAGKVTFDKQVNTDDLIDIIRQREAHYSRDFNNWLVKMGAQKEQSKTHFSMVLHGKAGQGKTFIVQEISKKLQRMLHLPLHLITSSEQLLKFNEKKRCIVVLDDIVRKSMDPETENQMMDLYNNKLHNQSLIINTTNVSPSIHIPFLQNISIIGTRFVKFLNEGLPRRIGFQGCLNYSEVPKIGMEIRCSNMRYFKLDWNIPSISLAQIWKDRRNVQMLILALIFAYLYPILLPLMIIVLAIVIQWKLTPTENEVKVEELPVDIFNSYLSFIKESNGIDIQYVSEIPPKGDHSLLIECQSSDNFMEYASLSELDNRLLTTKENFNKCNLDWKVFIVPELLIEMQRNLERYVVTEFSFTEDGVARLLARYVGAFKAAGIEPILKATFNDIGSFEYRDNKLSILKYEDLSDQRLAEPIFFELNGESYLEIEGVSWPVSKIDKFSIQEIIADNVSPQVAQQIYDFKQTTRYTLHPSVIKYRKEATRAQFENMMIIRAKQLKDKFKAFISHPLGAICMVILAVLTTYFVIRFLQNLFKTPKDSKKRRRQRKSSSSSSSDSSSEDEEPQRKGGRKGSPKTKSYDTDDDKHKKQRKGGRKGSPKTKSYDTDDDKKRKEVKEDVLTLADMNDFTAYKPYFSNAFNRARKNLCMMYGSPDGSDTLKYEPSMKLCYGLFVKKNMLVTVGHIVDVKENIFVGSDEFKDFYKCTRLFRYPERDISVWYVPTLKMEFKDITTHFLSVKQLSDEDEYNAVFQRFSPGKVEEFHASTFAFVAGPDFFPGQKGKLRSWGSMIYSIMDIKVTTGGDCGLPYYMAERSPAFRDKIIGIHCMGNVEGYKTSGISAVIFREDAEEWTERLEQAGKEKKSWFSKQCCNHLPVGKMLTIEPDSAPKCDGHQTVWHGEHLATYATFFEEYTYFIERNPQFEGSVLKHAGKLLGTQEHSHTQFLPDCDVILKEDVGPWRSIDLSLLDKKFKSLPPNGQLLVSNIQEKNLQNYLKKFKTMSQDFRIMAYRFKSATTFSWSLKFQIVLMVEDSTQLQVKYCDLLEKQQQSEYLVPFPSKFGDPIYVSPEVNELLLGAIKNKERGKLEDIPFDEIPNNETVKVIGSFVQSKSHLPNDHYKLSPFSKIVKDLIPIEKKPCVYDMSLIPDEEKEKMVEDKYGEPSQLATLSILWAHPIRGNKQQLIKISEQYETKIRSFYADLRVLTDDEVLQGIQAPDKMARYLDGMALDTSIGFTMKQLFYVTKKSDVISLDENGMYHWQRNAAADYLRNQYSIAKQLSAEGKKYNCVFTELLKMEKLKLAKIYKGRTFVAQDILGVLMERRNLGMLCARAYAMDPNCGIGTDPVIDFNRIYVRLIKHPNLWAGDYKNFDRHTPAVVQKEIRDILCKVNPKMKNEIMSTYTANIERIQVSGKTLSEVYGGMPSGCFTTAALNSLNNEYFMYACFYLLSEEANMDPSFKAYNDNVERMFYGDDVIVSVSDTYGAIFTRKNVSQKLWDLFGMELDSSAKDGTSSTFDNFETASWISRFFRKVGKYPFRTGALKKISIGANFHYVSSTEISHLGSLMEKAQWEAAFWEKEYFDKIQSAIRLCIAKNDKLLRYVNLQTYEAIHKTAFEMAGVNMVVKQIEEPIKPRITSWADEVEDFLARKQEEKDLIKINKISERSLISKSFIERYLFTRRYFKLSSKIVSSDNLENMKGTYAQKVNQAFQEGKISKPTFEFQSAGPQEHLSWVCTVTCEHDSHNVYGVGAGYSKQEAKEESCYELLKSLNMVEELKAKHSLNLANFKTEMNVSAGVVNKTPGAPMVAADVNVVADSGLYTNTTAPSPAKIINSTGIALDNPAGSGAPFNKHVACYNIYQRWDGKNTVISPAMASGVEVLRLSLDPKEYPSMISSYVDFHDSFIPELDIVVAIAGANGTIGWLTAGWVKDASSGKTYSLNDLQQVSMEETNMNGTQVIRIKLCDVRRTGLFRLRENDPEPYPGVIFMIDQAVTNVQRNDSVNYPVRVQVRLGSGCVLMEPFNIPSGGPTNDFNLGSYFYDSNVDLLIGSSAVTSLPTDVQILKDYGFGTRDFKPLIKQENAIAMDWDFEKDSVVLVFSPTDTPTPEFLNLVYDANTGSPIKGNKGTGPPRRIYYGYGTISKDLKGAYAEQPEVIGSAYTINEKKVKISGFSYIINKMYLQPEGCILVCDLDYVYNTDNNTDYLVYNNVHAIDKTEMQTLCNGMPGQKTSEHSDVDVFTVFGDEGAGDTYDVPHYTVKPLSKELYAPDTTFLVNIKTFVQTGNSMPSTNLPTGLKELSFVRPSTSSKVSGDQPFVPLYKPIIRNAYTAISEILRENKWSMAKADLYVAGVNRGQVGYQDGVLFVRTDDFRKILSGTGDDIKLKNLIKLDSVQGLASFNTTGYASWTTTTKNFHARKLDLSKFACESAIAGGMFSGLGSGISDWSKQLFQMQMLEKMQKANMALQGANNDAIAERQRLAFQRQLELTGYQGDSSQHGTVNSQFIGPRSQELTEKNGSSIYNKMNPGANLGQDFVYSEKFYPSSQVDKFSPITKIDEKQPDMTQFHNNPIYQPTKKYVPSQTGSSSFLDFLVPNQAPSGVEPIHEALDKELNPQARDAKFVAHVSNSEGDIEPNESIPDNSGNNNRSKN